MNMTRLRLVVLLVVVGGWVTPAGLAFAAGPRTQVYNEVEKGLELGLQGGFCWDFVPPVSDPGPGFQVGLEAGYDLNWVFRL